MLCAGTWLSGYFIVCTNAWMQHPVGYEAAPDGSVGLSSLWALLANPWAVPQYLHTMLGSLVTASFAMAGVGAYYLLRGEHVAVARRFTAVAVVAGFLASVLLAFPTGDIQAKLVHRHQPVAFAAMEGHFHTEDGAGLVLIGQPDHETMTLDNPIVLPRVLSFLTHQRWDATITGLADYDRDLWPTSPVGLYYAYHIMAGLGTIFIVIAGLGALSVWRGALERRRWLLWILMLSLPLPFIANTAGWMTAEFGRQPWIVHGLLRTADAHAENVSVGNVVFTLLGFAGLYAVLSLLAFFVLTRIVARGPETGAP
jgi:cytochrome d ubiquinol oxidase subunit I